MASVTIKVDVSDALQKKFEELGNPATMLAIHNTLAKRCDPYVPFLNGPLSQSVVVTEKGVTYIQPYARYQYYGEIYGPNIPIKDENGFIVGWWSPPGQQKHPTGRTMNHNTEYHPLATSFWDKAMLRDHREEFNEEVKDIIKWRLKQTDAGN